jgi:hypothetical protein
MKIAIIANEEKDVELLIKKASEMYENVLFAPVKEVRIENGKGRRILYKGTDISEMDVVFALPSRKYRDVFLAISVALEDSNASVPYDTNTLIAFEKKIIGMNILRKNNFSCLNIHHIIGENALRDILPEIEYPIKVRIGTKASLVEDEKQLKSMIKLRKTGQGISIEESLPSKRIGCLVVGDDIITAVEIINGKMRSTSIGEGTAKIAVSAAKSLGSSYAYLTISEDKILTFSLFPPLEKLQRVSGKDVSTVLLNILKEKNETTPKKKGIIQNILKSVGVKK